jgi:type VI secretion system protein ImpG
MLEYYNRELQFAREMGSEFAQAYPRIAARLGVEGLDCADPYVERLLEGFAFLTARVQLKLDARHPEFTQHLLELIYPHFLRPIPSCAVVEFAADEGETSLQSGYRVKRGTSLRTPLGKGVRTYCEFVTAHDVTLWPLIVAEAQYLSGSGLLAAQGLASDGRARAAIRLRLRSAPGVSLKSLRPQSLTFFLKATPDLASRLYEQIMADCTGFHARALHQGAANHLHRPPSSIRAVGFEDDEALLPVLRGGFQGYRLLQEYFALPERLLFFALDDLGDLFPSCEGQELEIYLALSRAQPVLERAVDASQFRLGCTPAVNLFPLAADRIHVSSTHTEMHLVPDRNRPMDFEVFSIERLKAIGAGGESMDEIRPFYAANHRTAHDAPRMYYTMQRRPRLISTRQQQVGARTAYVGSECFISVVDTAQRPFKGDMGQLDAQTLCTNRDLPILLSLGQGSTDLLVEGGAPVKTVRCLCGPSYPRQSPAFGDTSWNLISHLSLNYLSLVERNPQTGAEMLRDMLALYADPNSMALARQVEGVQGVSYLPVVRRTPIAGPACYSRGLEITVTLDDTAFEGTGILPLAGVLERFFARYVSLNSFTRMRLRSSARGEIKTWPVRVGRRQLI